MAKGSRRAKGRKRASEKLFIGVEVRAATPRQKALLKEIFNLSTVAVLGLGQAGGPYSNQSPIRKRPPPRR
jgi:hypothetical protein